MVMVSFMKPDERAKLPRRRVIVDAVLLILVCGTCVPRHSPEGAGSRLESGGCAATGTLLDSGRYGGAMFACVD